MNWTSWPRRSGVNGIVTTSGKGLCPAERNWMLAPVFLWHAGCVLGKRKKKIMFWVLPAFLYIYLLL